MISFGDIKELNKYIRKTLIDYSELHSDQVLNSLSVHGEDLNKLFADNVYVALNRQDAMMLFELRSRKNDSDMSQTEDDGSITSYRSFEMYLILYGSQSSDISTALCARLRTEKVRQELRTVGIYLEKVNEPDTTNEYINDTMWLRNDISVEISCKFSINIAAEHEFVSAEVNTLTV